MYVVVVLTGNKVTRHVDMIASSVYIMCRNNVITLSLLCLQCDILSSCDEHEYKYYILNNYYELLCFLSDA